LFPKEKDPNNFPIGNDLCKKAQAKFTCLKNVGKNILLVFKLNGKKVPVSLSDHLKLGPEYETTWSGIKPYYPKR